MELHDYIILSLVFGSLVFISAFIGYEYGVGVERLDALKYMPNCDLTCPKIPDCNCNCPSIDCPPIPDQPQLLRIAKDVADEIPYDREKWNCLDKSRELVDRLRQAEYDAHVVKGSVVSGYKNDTPIYERHAWVEVNGIHIEATGGYIITPQNYKNYIEGR